MNGEELLSPIEAAKLLGLSADMVRVLARTGRLLPAVKSTHGARLFRRADVLALLAERRGEAAQVHRVQFYEQRYPAEEVAAFLDEGLRAGAPAVLIATPAHRRAVRAQLRRRGNDLRELDRSGRLATLDAEQILADFLERGMPSPARFRARVSPLLESKGAGARFRPHVSGEMVDLLQRGGNPRAALALESLWTALGRELRFSLLCAYSLVGFPRSEDTGTFQQVCGAHAQVAPTEQLTRAPLELCLREVALLQQQAAALRSEVARREAAEASLSTALAELASAAAPRRGRRVHQRRLA